jgi:hypothetical protein
MKTLVLTLSLLISSAAISVQAQPVYVTENTPALSSSETPTAGIFAKIQRHMRVPESMKNTVSSERVRVVFTIDENGKAHVVDVCTRRPELKGSVTSQFEAIDFSDSKNTNGQEFSIWLNFKVM